MELTGSKICHLPRYEVWIPGCLCFCLLTSFIFLEGMKRTTSTRLEHFIEKSQLPSITLQPTEQEAWAGETGLAPGMLKRHAATVAGVGLGLWEGLLVQAHRTGVAFCSSEALTRVLE